ncbi:immunity repressor [Arthrobacter phage Orcanus]|nr:immunity repressor [Arthrobacter phage Orcanus]WAB09144.1 immunity repressor [Arthrobacter phage Eesa]
MSEQITLAELIRQHQDKTGDSYATIAHRAGLSKAKIGQLANLTQPHMPRIDTIEKVALGLRLPIRVVQQAAMASAGILPAGDYDTDQRIDLILTELRELDPDQLDTAARLIKALRNERRG